MYYFYFLFYINVALETMEGEYQWEIMQSDGIRPRVPRISFEFATNKWVQADDRNFFIIKVNKGATCERDLILKEL